MINKIVQSMAEAMAGIGQASEGVPRVVNVICDNALILAFGEGSGSVEARHVLGACRDLRLAAEVPQTKTNAPAPRLADPAPPPAYPVPAVDGYQMKTLERYCSAGGNPSLWSRLAGKLGIQQRGETA